MTQSQSALVDRTLRKIDALDAPGLNIVSSHGEIYKNLQEAARHLLQTAPLRLLHGLVADGTTAVNAEVVANTLMTGTHFKVPLPSDYARLVELQLSGWTMTRTNEDISSDSLVVYRKYLRGEVATTGEPVIFLTYYSDSTTAWAGTQALDVYPGTGELVTPVTYFKYIPDTAPESVPNTLMEALIWLAAGYLVTAIDPQLSEHCILRSAQMIAPRVLKERTAFTRSVRPMGL